LQVVGHGCRAPILGFSRKALDSISLLFIISPYSVAFGVILSLLFCFVLFVCTVEDILTQDGAIGVKFWLRVEHHHHHHHFRLMIMVDKRSHT